MKKLIFIFLISVITFLDVSAEIVETMLHVGHPVKDYAMTYDEKYIFTRGEEEICVWDLNNLMLIKILPIKTPNIYAHPADSRLIYISLNKTDSSLPAQGAQYAIIDWTDGKTIGYVGRGSTPEVRASGDLEVARYYNDILSFAPLTLNSRSTGWLGGLNVNIGNVSPNFNDSLLVTSGIYPQIWDLKLARPVSKIDYLEYIDPSIEEKDKYEYVNRLPYKKGFLPSIIKYYEASFIDGKEDIILGGVRDTVTIWSPDMDRHYELKKKIAVGEGPSPILSFKGDTIIAATEKGIFQSIGYQPFTKLEKLNEISGTSSFNTISSAYGNGLFLAAANNGRNVKATLLESDFEGNPTGRVSDRNLDFIQDIKVSHGRDYAALTYNNRGIAEVDLSGDTLKIGEAKKTDWLRDEEITRVAILPDAIIAAATTSGALNFWRKGETESFAQNRHHHGEINSISLSSDSLKMYTSDRNGQLTVWDTRTLEPIMDIYHIWSIDGEAYVFLTPDNYYKASPNAYRYINFVKDGKPYSFEQFDYRNNRPDIIVSRLGGNQEDIELLEKAWEKRLKRAGISRESLSEDFHVPETVIENRKRLPNITEEEICNFDIRFSDDIYNLNDINVLINGVPVLSPSQRKVSDKETFISLPLELASGVNEIEFFCTNEKGASSLRERVNITYTPKKGEKPNVYIFAAGVSDYKDPDFNLQYAGKDASDFSNMLKKQISKQFGKINVMLLKDKEFNEMMFPKVREFLKQARRDDVVIMFYAGHGVLDSELDYYLGTSSMNFQDPKDGGVAYEDFVSLLDETGSVNRYCFIDACHSGELDKDDYMAVNTVSLPADEELIFRAAGNGISAKAEVEKVNAVLEDNFLDLRSGAGASILSSAGGQELAVEGKKWGNGLFTYCLLSGIINNEADTDHDGTITLKEWVSYTKEKVSELSEGAQTPNLRSNNYHNDLKIK